MKIIALLVCLMLLGGCGLGNRNTGYYKGVKLTKDGYLPSMGLAKVNPSADYGPYPSKYKENIKAYFSAILKDPYSAKYRFGKPYKGYTRQRPTIDGSGGQVKAYGYIVELGVNSKNSYGGYTGEESYRFLIRKDQTVERFTYIPRFKEPWYQKETFRLTKY